MEAVLETPGKTKLLLEVVLVGQRGSLPSGQNIPNALALESSSFGWDVKPRSWLTVAIKDLMTIFAKSRVFLGALAKFPIWLFQPAT